MMMAHDNSTTDTQAAETREDSELGIKHYLAHNYPMVLFGVFFLLTMSMPIFLSGLFVGAEDSPVVSSVTVSPLYGGLIVLSFILAWVVQFTAPRLLGAYLVLVGVLALVFTGGGSAWAKGAWIGISFIGLVLFIMNLMRRN